jgi:hypothetical protein
LMGLTSLRSVFGRLDTIDAIQAQIHSHAAVKRAVSLSPLQRPMLTDYLCDLLLHCTDRGEDLAVQPVRAGHRRGLHTHARGLGTHSTQGPCNFADSRIKTRCSTHASFRPARIHPRLPYDNVFTALVCLCVWLGDRAVSQSR